MTQKEEKEEKIQNLFHIFLLSHDLNIVFKR